MGGLAWLAAAAVAALLASWAFSALVYLEEAPSAGRERAGVQVLRREPQRYQAAPRRSSRHRAGRRRPRLHPRGSAALPQVDPTLWADVRVLDRGEAERVRRRRERGEAGARRPHGAVPKEPDEPAHRPPPRQRPRPHRRRRVEAPPQGRAPGLQHGQDQDDDRHYV